MLSGTIPLGEVPKHLELRREENEALTDEVTRRPSLKLITARTNVPIIGLGKPLVAFRHSAYMVNFGDAADGERVARVGRCGDILGMRYALICR